MGANLAVSEILRLMLGIRHPLLVELTTQGVEPHEQETINS
jgi:hypothetical protein